MNINKQEKEYKEYLKIKKICKELWDEIRSIPYVKMEKPEQHGWFVDIELLPEIMRRDDSEKLNAVLKLFVNSHVLNKNQGNIVSSIRKLKTFNKCRKLFYVNYKDELVYVGPHINSLNEKEFKKVPEELHKYIYKSETQHVSRWGGSTYTTVRYHLNLPDYMFQLKVRKRMMTMVKDINPKLESDYTFYSYLEDKLGLKYRYYYDRDYRDRRNPDIQRPKVRDSIRKYLHGDIDDDKIFVK